MDYISVTVTVAYRPDFDVAVAEAVISKLGLKNETLIRTFCLEYGYNSLTGDFLHAIRKSTAYIAEKSKIARISGQAAVEVYVAIGVINDIKSFFQKAVEAAKERAKDAARQVVEGNANAKEGVVKDLKEGANDMDQGAGEALKGVYDLMTNPVASEDFMAGFRNTINGTRRFQLGGAKFFLMTPLDYGVMSALKGISGVQTLSFLGESIGRQLTSSEISELQKVFASSVEYSVVRVKTGYAGILNIGRGGDGKLSLYNNGRAITIGNTIYMKNTSQADWMSVLVHEMTHVWQNQNGGTDYMIEALWAQEVMGSYAYLSEIVVTPPQNPKTWAMLNPEQQGQLIQDAYDAGYFTINKGQWISRDRTTKVVLGSRPDLATYMQNVVPQLKTGQGAT